MSTTTITGRQAPTSEFVLIDPTTGLALGTAAAPLTTATSSLQTIADLTKSIIASTTIGTTPLIAAAASNRGRAYRVRIDAAGANVITITDATGPEEMNFIGAGFKVLDFATRPWYTTAVNTALNMTTTTIAKVNVTIEWTRVP